MDGGAIFLNSGTFSVNFGNFSNNEASGRGGAIKISNARQVKILKINFFKFSREISICFLLPRIRLIRVGQYILKIKAISFFPVLNFPGILLWKEFHFIAGLKKIERIISRIFSDSTVSLQTDLTFSTPVDNDIYCDVKKK